MPSHTSDSDDDATVWCAVAGVQSVVFLARMRGRPVAILELRPGQGFHLTSCTGAALGQFASVAEGQAALEEWLASRTATARPAKRMAGVHAS